MRKIFRQIIKFAVVGVSAFMIDYVLMVLITEVFSINYLLSNAISFSASVIYNYILSIFWVFDVDSSKSNQCKNLVIFIVLSMIGLLINQLLMWIQVNQLNIYYMIAKIFATVVVMVYNFISRKIYLEAKIE